MVNNVRPCVIGDGLIANAVRNVDFGRPVLALASGVSNSQEVRPEAFCRELELVKDAISRNPDLHVLYFSTCSVVGVSTPYTLHKLRMERLVESTANSYHVFRLPQVVGLVKNRTLVSYFVDSILRGRLIQVQTNATRSILDVRDFTRVAGLLVRRSVGTGSPVNIAPFVRVPVADIVREIAQLVGRPARTEFVDGGYSQTIDVNFLRRQLSSDDRLFDRDYWRMVLDYYVPLMVASMSDEEGVS
jgi:nucleoside-diphosphate-sugar epimerase